MVIPVKLHARHQGDLDTLGSEALPGLLQDEGG